MSTSPMRSSRSLAACEGALLVVDAAQGVEAQTLANVYQSIEHDHEIVPVINKIDLPAADPRRCAQEIEEIIGLDAIRGGARQRQDRHRHRRGAGGDRRHASRRPRATRTRRSKAMLVDSWYDPYLGVVILDPRHRRRHPQGPADQVHGRRHHPSGRPRRLLPPQDRAVAASSAPARSASSPRRSRKSPRPASATPSPTPGGPPPRRCPASSWSSRWSSAACSRSTPTISRSSATASPSCASTTPASASRWRPAPRSASASAAASSACSTSRSSRSG